MSKKVLCNLYMMICLELKVIVLHVLRKNPIHLFDNDVVKCIIVHVHLDLDMMLIACGLGVLKGCYFGFNSK